MITKEQKKKLCHAGTPRIRLTTYWNKPKRWWFSKVIRGANFGMLYFGPLEITWPMPWLEYVARQLYPEIFKD